MSGTATWSRKSLPPDTTNADDLWQRGGPVAERLDDLPGRRADGDGGERLNLAAERLEGDVGAVAGLIPTGLPVLAAPAEELPALRAAALDRGLLVVGLPGAAQTTTDYAAFRETVAATAVDELRFLALLVSGPPKAVRALTGSLPLLR